jgi:ABC-2 type transport system permease protein
MTKIIKYEKLLGKNLFKWFALFYLNYKAFTAYRLNTLSYLLTQVVILLGTLIIWYYNISNGSTGLGFAEIVSYYLIGQIFIVQIEPHWSVSEDIQYGKFSTKLLRPESTWISYLVEDLGTNLFTNIIKVSISAGLAIMFSNYIILPTNPVTYLIFAAALVIAYSINILISFLVSFITFYVTNSHGTLELYSQIKIFCSGWYFPLNILPITQPLLFLPFAFTYYYPTQIFLEKQPTSQSLAILGYGVIIIFLLYFLASVVYKNGLKHYESVGL